MPGDDTGNGQHRLPPMKKIFLLSVLCSCSLLLSVRAQQPQPASNPQSTALAEELMTLFQIDKSMQAALQQVTQMQTKMLDSQNLSPEAKVRQQQVMKTVIEETQASFTWEKIKPTFIEIYAETFSPEELQGMITFFKSPIGQKWIEKQPQLQAATMQKMQALIVGMQPKIQEAIKRSLSAPETKQP